MKKTLRNIALVILMGLILVSLAGCGSNKLVATRTTEDQTIGTYKEEVVMTFKKDKLTNIEESIEFDKEETAKAMYSALSFGASLSNESTTSKMEFKQEDKKIVTTIDAKAYAESKGISDEEMTKDALKAVFEEEGYTVK